MQECHLSRIAGNEGRDDLSLAMPDLGPHPTLFLTELATAFATFFHTHTLFVSSQICSHTPSHGATFVEKT